MKTYLSAYPRLVKEWHPIKNGDSKSDGYTSGSNIRVWWKCPKSDQHDWEASIKSRTRGSGCPSCSGNKVSPDNNLAAMHPKIAIEWHPTKNKNDKPEDFTHGSNRKVYWLCPKGHDYRSAIKERTRKNPTGCSVCLGKK